MDYDTHENGCPMCGGPLMLLGQLRNRINYRCKNCSYQCSWKVEDKPADAAGSGTDH
jgi:tRNA(Ile2) C34 agmatinyltransferase TiaS